MQMYASVKPPKTYWEFSEAVLSLHSNQVHQRLPWNKQRNNRGWVADFHAEHLAMLKM